MTKYPLYTSSTLTTTNTTNAWYVMPSTYTTSSSTNVIWQEWVDQTTSTSTIWRNWIVTPQVTIQYQPHNYYWQNTPVAPVLTDEQIRQENELRERRRIERDRVWREQQAQRTAAQVKAIRLLKHLLSDEQRAELDAHGQFHVQGSRGRRYCIRANGQSGNVAWVDDAGKELGRFCAHPDGSQGYLPDADAWLAQAMALQTDEDAFLAVANVHAGRRPSGLIVPVAA
jgi:hypothetical protein